MRLTNHAAHAGCEYHFESSDDYCEPGVIHRAERAVRAATRLSAADEAQLLTIVSLENVRYAFAQSGEDNPELMGKQIQALRNALIREHHREPFDNGRIDQLFYEKLNEEYGYVG